MQPAVMFGSWRLWEIRKTYFFSRYPTASPFPEILSSWTSLCLCYANSTFKMSFTGFFSNSSQVSSSQGGLLLHYALLQVTDSPACTHWAHSTACWWHTEPGEAPEVMCDSSYVTQLIFLCLLHLFSRPILRANSQCLGPCVGMQRTTMSLDISSHPPVCIASCL